MADLDTGHIFLTTLAPIKKPDPNGRLSAEQWVRIKLAGMAPAMQSPAAVKSGENSPFSRNRRTHLARMFVLNNVIYNGRVGKNTLWSLVKGIFTKKKSA